MGQTRGFVKLKKIGVGGWVKSQLGFWGGGECVCFFVFFLCCFHVSKCFKKIYKKIKGGGWMLTNKSEFFSDFFIFFNLTRPLNFRSTSKTVVQHCSIGPASMQRVLFLVLCNGQINPTTVTVDMFVQPTAVQVSRLCSAKSWYW